jgi:site-specific recombinase
MTGEFYRGIAYSLEVMTAVLDRIEADMTMPFAERLAAKRTIHAINEILSEQLNAIPEQPPIDEPS